MRDPSARFFGMASLGLAIVVAVGFAACGGNGGDQNAPLGDGGDDDSGANLDVAGFDVAVSDGPGKVVALVFDPPSVTVTIDGSGPKTATYTLKATSEDGATTTVTAESLEFDRPDLAKMTSGTNVDLTSNGPYAGKGVLHAVYRGLEATASLQVIVNVRDVSPGVDPTAVKALDAPGLPADPAVTSLLYPYDKTVFPLGITSPKIMWNAPKPSDVYKIHLAQKNYTFDGYYVVTPPARLRVDQTIWDTMTASNDGTDPMTLTISRWEASTLKTYSCATETFTIAPASLRGAIYYWTTSGTGHMARIRPGTGAKPEVLNGGKCMGCHAVSADGSTLVASVEGAVTSDGSGDNRAWVSFDLPAATVRRTSTYFAGNVAVNPNGKYTVFGTQKLRLADTATGTVVATSGLDTIALDPGMAGLMTPAFSPDGKRLAAVMGAGSWYHNLVDGKLVVIDFDEATLKFSGLKGLAPASSFSAGQRAIAYPTFAPDSNWIAFHVGDYATGCDVQGCDDAAKQLGTIWMQNVSGAPAVKLANLTDSSKNVADHNVSYEPTFNPNERGGYFWAVFTSSRDWGNQIVGTANNGKKRLWVAAVDKSGAGADPSHPAFFLEGQEETTTNMRGFWALAACIPTKGGGACTSGFECCSGFCDKGVCIDIEKKACKGVSEACTVDADCCNAAYVHCEGGVCAPLKPK